MTRFNASIVAFVLISALGSYALFSFTGLHNLAAWRALWLELKGWLQEDEPDAAEWHAAAARCRAEAKQYGEQAKRAAR